MSLQTSLKAIPINRDTENQSKFINGKEILEISVCQDSEVLSEGTKSHTSKLLASHPVKISFYNPQDSLISPVKEAHIEEKTSLEELASTLQDLLEGITTGLCEPYQIKSVHLRILNQESYRNFSWPTPETKDGNDIQEYSEKLIWDQLEKMEADWIKFRSKILTDDKNPKKIRYPILVVQTIRSYEDTRSLPNPADNELTSTQKLTISSNSEKEDVEKSVIGSVSEIPFFTKRHNTETNFKDDENIGKPIIENENEIEEGFEIRNKDLMPKNLVEKASTQLEMQNREIVENGDPKIQETLPSQLKSQMDSPDPSMEEQNKSSISNIVPIENLQTIGDLEKRKINAQIIPSESAFTCLPDCHEIDNKLSSQDKGLKTTTNSFKDFKAGYLSPKLTRDLEKYRRFHESAVSYANEDEEVFFPLTPDSTPKLYNVSENQQALGDKHQITQLDLDKIVKDAISRKMNKKRISNLELQVSPILNLSEDMIYDQQYLLGQGFTQDMSISQEQSELQQLELMYAYNMYEQGDKTHNQISPGYYLSPISKNYAGMPSMIPEQNLLSDYGVDELNYMGHNLPYISGGIVDYPNNDYNPNNLYSSPYSTPNMLGSSGAYYMNNSYHFDSGYPHINSKYVLKNRMNIPSPRMWNKAHSRGVS